MKYLKLFEEIEVDFEDWDYEEEPEKVFFIVRGGYNFYIVSKIKNSSVIEIYMGGSHDIPIDGFFPLSGYDIDMIVRGLVYIRVRDKDGLFTDYKLKDLPLDLKDLMYYNQEKKIVPLPL